MLQRQRQAAPRQRLQCVRHTSSCRRVLFSGARGKPRRTSSCGGIHFFRFCSVCSTYLYHGVHRTSGSWVRRAPDEEKYFISMTRLEEVNFAAVMIQRGWRWTRKKDSAEVDASQERCKTDLTELDLCVSRVPTLDPHRCEVPTGQDLNRTKRPGEMAEFRCEGHARLITAFRSSARERHSPCETLSTWLQRETWSSSTAHRAGANRLQKQTFSRSRCIARETNRSHRKTDPQVRCPQVQSDCDHAVTEPMYHTVELKTVELKTSADHAVAELSRPDRQ